MIPNMEKGVIPPFKENHLHLTGSHFSTHQGNSTAFNQSAISFLICSLLNGLISYPSGFKAEPKVNKMCERIHTENKKNNLRNNFENSKEVCE